MRLVLQTKLQLAQSKTPEMHILSMLNPQHCFILHTGSHCAALQYLLMQIQRDSIPTLCNIAHPSLTQLLPESSCSRSQYEVDEKQNSSRGRKVKATFQQLKLLTVEDALGTLLYREPREKKRVNWIPLRDESAVGDNSSEKQHFYVTRPGLRNRSNRKSIDAGRSQQCLCFLQYFLV